MSFVIGFLVLAVASVFNFPLGVAVLVQNGPRAEVSLASYFADHLPKHMVLHFSLLNTLLFLSLQPLTAFLFLKQVGDEHFFVDLVDLLASLQLHALQLESLKVVRPQVLAPQLGLLLELAETHFSLVHSLAKFLHSFFLVITLFLLGCFKFCLKF